MTTDQSKKRNFDNALREYNRRVILRSRMHTYSKNYIDNLMHKAVFDKCTVPIDILSEEEVEKIKLSLIKNNDKKSKSDEPVIKIQKLDTSGIDIMKIVLSRDGESDKFKSKFKSSLKPNKEIPSASAQGKPMEVDCTEFTEIVISSTKQLVGKIWCRNYKTLFDESMLTRYEVMFLNLKPKPPMNGTKKSVLSVKPSSKQSGQTVNGVKHPLNGRNLSMRENLNKIEQLYTKYFCKSVQDTIVTIANILNVIAISNNHHKARMDQSFRIKTESYKLKERCNANQVHDKHKVILEQKLSKYFSIVVRTFEELEFDSTFIMFFQGILTVLRSLDQPKFKKGSILKNVILLLWNSLKNSNYENPKVYSMFRSKTFRTDCIDLKDLIEDSRDSDPEITDRLKLFFVSTNNSRDYFQAVIDTVTRDYNEDLGVLIDNASMQCSINSKFKDSIAVSNSYDIITPVTANETNQQWIVQKKHDRSCHIPVQNGYKSQTNCNTAKIPTFVTNFYKSLSNLVQKEVSSESSTSKVIPAKKCDVVLPSTFKSPLVQFTASETTVATSTITTSTFESGKPLGQNKRPLLSNPPNTTDKTIYVNNKQYQLVKSPLGQIRDLVNGNNILVKSPPSIIIKCYAKNCNNVATIMCSNCTTVKYCSFNCQRIHWYGNHIHDCQNY